MHHELLTGVILRRQAGGSDDVDDMVVVAQSAVRANRFLAVSTCKLVCSVVSGSGNVGLVAQVSRGYNGRVVLLCSVEWIAAHGCGATVEILAHNL